MGSIRKALLIALLLFFAAAAALPVGTVAAERSKLFLWEVKSDRSTIYLLGSIHLGRPEFYPLDPVIENAYRNASTLVVEVNLNEVDEETQQMYVLERGMYPPDKSLKKSVSEETYMMLGEFLLEREIDAMAMGMMKPWLVAITLTVVEMQRLGYDPALGIDQHFLNLAVEEKKRILQLESFELQIDLFSGFDDEMQENFLVQSMLEMEEIADLLDGLMDAWTSGDEDALEAVLFEAGGEDERFRQLNDRLYRDRNIQMTGKIRRYLEAEGAFFVVVGAGHLVGEKSIVNLLRGDEKYSIRQMESNVVGSEGESVAAGGR